MTQTIYTDSYENTESRPRLELVAEPDFEQEFKDLLDYVQDAGEQMGRCPEVTEAERAARQYARKHIPNGAVLHISVPKDASAYDHNGFQMDSCPEVFRCDFFAGFEIGKARFIDLATSHSVIIPDIRQANLRLTETPKNKGANCE